MPGRCLRERHAWGGAKLKAVSQKLRTWLKLRDRMRLGVDAQETKPNLGGAPSPGRTPFPGGGSGLALRPSRRADVAEGSQSRGSG